MACIGQLSLDILLAVTDHLQEFDSDSGERWSSLLPEYKYTILNARAVCRGFRDAFWPAYSKVLAQRRFFLIEQDLDILHEMAIHPVLRQLTTTITFGGQCFSRTGLNLFDHIIDSHPTGSLGSSGHSDDAWQLGLAHLVDSDIEQVFKARDLYQQQLESQEVSWASGRSVLRLKEVFGAMPRLQTVRLDPRPFKTTLKVAGPFSGNLSKAIHSKQFREWRDLRRVSEALSSIEDLVDFRLSYFSNVSVPLLQPSVFRHLRVAKLTLTERELTDDEQYVDNGSSALHACLDNAPELTTLDLEIKYMSESNLRSKILATMAAASTSPRPPPYKLQHLVLEQPVISEENLATLIRSHKSTLHSVILVLPWIRPGSWNSLLKTMIREGMYLDYLEIWKPSQGGVSYYENMNWIDLGLLMRVSREGKLIKFEGEMDDENGEWLNGSEDWAETWENSQTRRGRR
jgi:hypothetical protein